MTAFCGSTRDRVAGAHVREAAVARCALLAERTAADVRVGIPSSAACNIAAEAAAAFARAEIERDASVARAKRMVDRVASAASATSTDVAVIVAVRSTAVAAMTFAAAETSAWRAASDGATCLTCASCSTKRDDWARVGTASSTDGASAKATRPAATSPRACLPSPRVTITRISLEAPRPARDTALCPQRLRKGSPPAAGSPRRQRTQSWFR